MTNASFLVLGMTMSTPSITTQLRGETIARDQVLDWEDRRITAAARKLGLQAPAGGDVSTRREALLQAKLTLGPEEITTRLSRDIRVAEFVGKAGARVSKRRRVSVVDLYVNGGSAGQFVDAFEGWAAASDGVVRTALASRRSCRRARSRSRRLSRGTARGSRTSSRTAIRKSGPFRLRPTLGE